MLERRIDLGPLEAGESLAHVVERRGDVAALSAQQQHDDVLDIFDTFFTTLFADATAAGIKERLRTLKDLDAAALQLATIGAMVLDPTLADADLRSLVLTIISPEEITLALDQVADLAQPPDDTYYDELATRYRRLSRVRPTFLRTMQFDALPGGKPIADAYRFLQTIEPKPRASLQNAPRTVINRRWQRYAITAQHTSTGWPTPTVCSIA